MNETPSGERVQIGFFGMRNAGKSSLVNAVTGQDLSVVSEVRGTTTDPVRKAMEILPLGPVVVIDTPGFDDEGDLGEQRVRKAREVLATCDVAVLVVDGQRGLGKGDRTLLGLFSEREVPFVVAWNKADLPNTEMGQAAEKGGVWVSVSATEGTGVWQLKEAIARLGADRRPQTPLVSDLVGAGEVAVLVIPIDSSAPKGRIILPQQQVLRDLLDVGAMGLCVRETELEGALAGLARPPKLVITDSQAFAQVARIVPEEVPLTSFSILMARRKGLLETAVRGVRAIDALRDGDRVLISEGCTHHRQCEDIGTVKIPHWLREATGRDLSIETSSGRGFPDDLTPYALVIHCGGCMLSEREVMSRMHHAAAQGVPITNYGIAIAHMKGILARSIAVLGM